MGYDMFLRTPDPAVTAAKDQAQAAFNAAVKERDAHPRGSAEAEAAQAVVTQTYEALYDTDTNYYRLNIWGMGWAREVMLEIPGMLQPELDVPSFEWPEYREEDETEDGENPVYRAAVEPILRAGGEGSGIPLHKLCDNSGWIVTPAECGQAVKAYRTWIAQNDFPAQPQDGWSPAEQRERFEEWVAFIERGVTHDGFEVH